MNNTAPQNPEPSTPDPNPGVTEAEAFLAGIYLDAMFRGRLPKNKRPVILVAVREHGE